MREIKFRAWNKVEGFMDTAWLIDWEHGLVCHRSHNQSKLEDCELMQYTGLKDKNGKEIYEGDILSFEDDKFVWKVTYDMDCFVASGGKHNQNEELMNFYDWQKERLDLVIIGNIYEHPNLLENN